nr:acyl-CoA thioester hydrolase/BAAT C-terminal domain-containing protein [uncultured Allomuricauda sp.]
MKRVIFYLSLLFLAGCQNSKDDMPEVPFSNFMEYGEYSVGFKTLFTTDDSRESVPYADWSGKLYPEHKASEGRKLPIHIWYPTSDKSKLLSYAYFVKLMTAQTEEDLKRESDTFAKKIFAYQVNQLKGEDGFTMAQLDTLLALKTNASLNTHPIQQKFPLVIFPNGASPAYQSILCEYLASHGFVVAAVALKGEFSHVRGTSVKGLETAVSDLQFTLGQLFKLPNVNKEEVALIGNAMASSICASLASRNKKIKALISLEGGLLSQFEQNILNETNFYEPQRITLPLLAIYAPHPSISPEQIYHLNYSERYFAHFPEMSEFHFLNFGPFEAYVPNIIGQPKGDVKKGFKVSAELVLAFLDAKLKQEEENLNQFYGGEIPEKFEKTIDTLFRLDGFNPPPNMAILKNLFITKGMYAIDSIYQSHISEGNPKPFSNTFYNDFKNWLAWKKDPDYVYRMHLYEMAAESYPESTLNHYRLGYYLEKNNLAEKSQLHYKQAKKLIDEDNTITPSLKRDLESALNEVIK